MNRNENTRNKPMILNEDTKVKCFDCNTPVTRVYPVRIGKREVYVCIDCESKGDK